MPRITLTDLTIRNLKPTGKQTQYWDASLPSFGVRVNQSGRKTFNVMIGQERRLLKIGNYPEMGLAEARKTAHDLMDANNPSSIAFPTARDLFFTKHLDTLKATTAHEQKNLMRRFPFTKPVSAITLNDIQRVLEDMPRGSARSCFNIIRTFLNWCVENDYLEKSPLKKSPYKPSSRDRLLSDQEVQQIWTESRNHAVFGVIIRLALLTGQRIGQISEFQPHWVEADLIVFPATIMKSNQDHALPLTDAIRNELENHRPLISLSRPMEKFRDALEVEHFTLHDFRRYFSSTMAKLKVPIDVTEAILDHRSGSRSQIQRIYDRHDRLPEIRDALTLYHQHLSRFCEGLNMREPR